MPSPTPTPSVPTVTITAAGVSPQEVRIAVGAQVQFVNNDTVNRQINSDPFPAHDDCPPLNVGLITPGQSAMTGAMTLPGACGFHEHLTEGAAEFLGVILVGEGATPNDAPPSGY
jgi:plastocyanin